MPNSAAASCFDSATGEICEGGADRRPFGEVGEKGCGFRKPVLVNGRSLLDISSESTPSRRSEPRLDVLGGGGIGDLKPLSVGDLGGRGGGMPILSCDRVRFASRIGGTGGGGGGGRSFCRDAPFLIAFSPADGSSWWKNVSEEKLANCDSSCWVLALFTDASVVLRGRILENSDASSIRFVRSRSGTLSLGVCVRCWKL